MLLRMVNPTAGTRLASLGCAPHTDGAVFQSGLVELCAAILLGAFIEDIDGFVQVILLVSPTLSSGRERSFGRGRELSVGPQLIGSVFALGSAGMYFVRAPRPLFSLAPFSHSTSVNSTGPSRSHPPTRSGLLSRWKQLPPRTGRLYRCHHSQHIRCPLPL